MVKFVLHYIILYTWFYVCAEVRITNDTQLEDNTLFDPFADIPVKPQRKKKPQSVDSTNFDIGQMTGKKRWHSLRSC